MGRSSVSHDFHVGNWLVEPSLCRVSRAGRTVHLRPKLIDLLEFLASNQGRMVGKDEILERVWHGEFVVESVLGRSIADLRHALGDDAASPRVIETIPKRGYRLIAPVREAGGPSVPPAPSIAVLPFSNLTPETGQQYFCDGLTEEITSALAAVPGLRVTARTSAFVFRDGVTDVREVGRRLGVSHVLEGSVRRADGELRITVQLIDASDGCHRWSRRFDRPARAVFALQDEVARAVASVLEVTLLRDREGGRARPHTTNAEAHDSYLRGRYLFAQRTAPALAAAAECFHRAIDRDPAYALGYAGLADCNGHAGFLGHRPPGEAFPQAIAAARRCLELDPSLADGHVALAVGVSLYEWKWDEAEDEFRRAIELAPSHATAHLGYSNLLATLGRAVEAREQIKIARQLDPLSPLMQVCLAMRLGEERQFEPALQQLQATLAANPEFGTVHLHLARTYWALDRLEEALTHLRPGAAGFPLALGLMGAVLGRLGRRQEADEVIAELSRLSTQRHVGAAPVALAYQGLGDLDKALEWYSKAFDAHEGILAEFVVDPVTDVLRTDPRFTALVDRMRLPPAPGSRAGGR